MEQAYASLITAIGEDLNRAGLADTPKRAAKAFQYLCKGYDEDLDTIVNNAIFPSDNDQMVIVRDIELYSLITVYWEMSCRLFTVGEGVGLIESRSYC